MTWPPGCRRHRPNRTGERVYRLLPKRVGRRGTCLIAISGLYLNGGTTQYLQPPKTQVTMDQLHYLYLLAPPRIWAFLWVFVGAFALVGAFGTRGRVRSMAFGLV